MTHEGIFFAPVSGSVTAAGPALRRRRVVPVGHQMRVSWWLYPAPWRTRQRV